MAIDRQISQVGEASPNASALLKEWLKVTSLSELDIATLSCSAHLDKLRAIKANGGEDRNYAWRAMLNVFDLTTLSELEIEGDVLGVLQSTRPPLMNEVYTRVNFHMTVADAIREVVIHRMFNGYLMHNISAIAEEESLETMKGRRDRTLYGSAERNLSESRRIIARSEIDKIIGEYRYLEDDPDMSDADPHIVLVIARKELEALEFMEKVYNDAPSSVKSQAMLKRVGEVTRPKLLALVAQMEARVGTIRTSDHNSACSSRLTEIVKTISASIVLIFRGVRPSASHSRKR